MKAKIISKLFLLPLIFALTACTSQTVTQELPSSAAPSAQIRLNYERQLGSGSNQFAIWIEDENGSLIKTIYATSYTADGGYEFRPDSIPIWVEKSGLPELAADQIDAISSATPDSGVLTYTWDFTDDSGNLVPAEGKYKFFIEGTLFWKNSVLYSGDIDLTGALRTIEATAEYHYEAADNQPALTEKSPANNMIADVQLTIDNRQ